MSSPSLTGSLSSITTSVHSPNCQNCNTEQFLRTPTIETHSLPYSGQTPEDEVPESGRFQHSHLGRTAHVGQPDEEASHSGWESRWLPRASSHLRVRRGIYEPPSNYVFLLFFMKSLTLMTQPTRTYRVLPDRCLFWWHHPLWTEGPLSVPTEKLKVWMKTFKYAEFRSTLRRHIFQTPAILSIYASTVCVLMRRCKQMSQQGVVCAMRCQQLQPVSWVVPVHTCPILFEFAVRK